MVIHDYLQFLIQVVELQTTILNFIYILFCEISSNSHFRFLFVKEYVARLKAHNI